MDFNLDKIKKAQFARTVKRLGITMVVLFGSAATGSKKPEDIDLMVFLSDEVREKTLADFGRQNEVAETLADFLGVYSDKLDVLFMSNRISPLLAYHVARDGKLLFGSEKEFMRFQLFAVKIFQDAEKFRTAQENYLQRIYAR
ncbi:MAG: nucleotidyltransferase domain-containing protein [Patescibacteria group bacterium]|nr:nucleotidyltransferase domain-containing protein [Patescibacteria group bacterium]